MAENARYGLQLGSGQRNSIRFALGELEYLQSLPRATGGITRGDEFFFAFDLRPSSSAFVPELGRGEIAQAIERAIHDAGHLKNTVGER